jgi:ribonuclease P/MRP protein subunit RPP40
MDFDMGQREGKCYFTHATLKKEPFQAIHHPHNLQLSLLLPSTKQQDFETLQYARVYMKPLDLISGEFFNTYIKSGDIIMLSEGRSGIDTVFSLSEGILRIEVDKPTYERLGLEGKVVGGEGRKHIKARFGKSRISAVLSSPLRCYLICTTELT